MGVEFNPSPNYSAPTMCPLPGNTLTTDASTNDAAHLPVGDDCSVVAIERRLHEVFHLVHGSGFRVEEGFREDSGAGDCTKLRKCAEHARLPAPGFRVPVT